MQCCRARDTKGDACDDDDDADGFLEIRTEEQLSAIRSNLDEHYELKAGIALSTNTTNSWQPIGNGTDPFRGQVGRQRSCNFRFIFYYD